MTPRTWHELLIAKEVPLLRSQGISWLIGARLGVSDATLAKLFGASFKNLEGFARSVVWERERLWWELLRIHIRVLDRAAQPRRAGDLKRRFSREH